MYGVCGDCSVYRHSSVNQVIHVFKERRLHSTSLNIAMKYNTITDCYGAAYLMNQPAFI